MLADALLSWTVVIAVLTALLVGAAAAGLIVQRRANAREAEVALAGVAWTFHFELRPVAGSDGVLGDSPVEVRPLGANLWVHEVRLSWRPAQQGTEWVTDDATCAPYRPEDGPLPVQLFTTGRGLKLAWPGPNPPEVVQLTTRVRVLWSATAKGPKHWRDAESGSTNWQPQNTT